MQVSRSVAPSGTAGKNRGEITSREQNAGQGPACLMAHVIMCHAPIPISRTWVPRREPSSSLRCVSALTPGWERPQGGEEKKGMQAESETDCAGNFGGRLGVEGSHLLAPPSAVSQELSDSLVVCL